MFNKDKIFKRTKAYFVARYIVFFNTFKIDFVAQLAAESIKDAIEQLYPDGRYNQSNTRRVAIQKFKEKFLYFLE